MIFQLIKTKIIKKNLLSSLISLNLSKVVNQMNFLSFCLSICLSLAEYSSKYQLTKNSRFVFLQDLIRETTFWVCVCFFFQMAKGRPWSLDYHINKWYFFLFLFFICAPPLLACPTAWTIYKFAVLLFWLLSLSCVGLRLQSKRKRNWNSASTLMNDIYGGV